MADDLLTTLLQRPQVAQPVPPEVQDALARQEQSTWSPARQKLIGGLEGAGEFLKGLLAGDPTDPTSSRWDRAGQVLGAGIPLWHGSPKLFGKFMFKPGARGMLRGPGVYAADNVHRAQSYQPPHRIFFKSIGDEEIDNLNTQLTIASHDINSTNRDKIWEYLQKHPQYNQEILQKMASLDPIQTKRGGYLYSVDFDADPSKLIKLTEPMSQQTPFVRSALEDVPNVTSGGRELKGLDAVNILQRNQGAFSPSDRQQELLTELVKRGLKGGTAPHTRDSFDHVVYDPESLNIKSILSSFGRTVKIPQK